MLVSKQSRQLLFCSLSRVFLWLSWRVICPSVGVSLCGFYSQCLHLPPGGPLGKPVVPFCQIHIPKVQFWWHYISPFRPSGAPQYLPNELHTPYLSFKASIPPPIALRLSASLDCVYTLYCCIYCIHQAWLVYTSLSTGLIRCSEQWLLVGRKQASSAWSEPGTRNDLG